MVISRSIGFLIHDFQHEGYSPENSNDKAYGEDNENEYNDDKIANVKNIYFRSLDIDKVDQALEITDDDEHCTVSDETWIAVRTRIVMIEFNYVTANITLSINLWIICQPHNPAEETEFPSIIQEVMERNGKLTDYPDTYMYLPQNYRAHKMETRILNRHTVRISAVLPRLHENTPLTSAKFFSY